MPDLAALRLRNTQILFDAFVAGTVARAAASDLRGLEKLFAEQLRISPSYWSQLKGGQRHIGAKLARQFEALSGKPAGWLDTTHEPPAPEAARAEAGLPADADERFAVGVFLTAYRLDREAVRRQLLDVLEGELAKPAAAARVARAPQSNIQQRATLTKIK